ncbi:MAG: hypothetical protein AAFR38_07560 [Planctomycetota bacterium]
MSSEGTAGAGGGPDARALADLLMGVQSSAVGKPAGERRELLSTELRDHVSGLSSEERSSLLAELVLMISPAEPVAAASNGSGGIAGPADLPSAANQMLAMWGSASEAEREAVTGRLAGEGIVAPAAPAESSAPVRAEGSGAGPKGDLSELRKWLGLGEGDRISADKVEELAEMALCRLVGGVEPVARQLVKWVSGTEGPPLSAAVAEYLSTGDPKAGARLAARLEGTARTIATLLVGLRGAAATMTLSYGEVFAPDSIRATVGAKKRNNPKEDARCWARYCELHEEYTHDKVESLMNRRLAADLAELLGGGR